MCRRRSKLLHNLWQYALKSPNLRGWSGDLIDRQCESTQGHRQLGRDTRAGQCGGRVPGDGQHDQRTVLHGTPTGACGTSATRAPFASTRALVPATVPAPASPAAITSTWSPGRNKRTAPASAIRTGADTNRAGRRACAGAAPASPPAPAPYAASPPVPAPPPPSPVAASAAAVRASPAARARRCRHNARRSRRPPPPRTRKGSNTGTPQGGGAGDGDGNAEEAEEAEGDTDDARGAEDTDDVNDTDDGNMVDTTCHEEFRTNTPHDPPSARFPPRPVDSPGVVENSVTRPAAPSPSPAPLPQDRPRSPARATRSPS